MTDDDRLLELLRTAMPPVRGGELARDLWPRIAGEERPAEASRDAARSANASRRVSMVPWIDLALAAAAIGALLLLPGSLVLLAYHL